MDSFDAIVIGGGPAGAAAATTLARGGARVVVLEAARFPRDKTCGDALGLDARRQLEQLGLLHRVRAVARATFRGVALTGPSGIRVELSTADRSLPGFSDHTYCIPRRVLDHVLIQAAVDEGAELREGVRVREVRFDGGRAVGVRCQDGTELRAPVVIGCAGEHDPLSRQVGRGKDPRRKAFAVRVYYEDLPEPVSLPEIDFGEEVLPGYGWVFPVSPTSANVGVGLRADLLKQRGGDLRGLLERYVAHNPSAKRWLAGGRRATAVRGWPLTFGSQARRTSGPGWMLAGDAAGLIDPVTGEGIGNALLSGRLAGEAALRGDPLALASYDRAWRRELAWNFKAGHLLQELLTRPWVVDRVLRQALRRFTLGTELAAMVSGAHSKARAFAPSTLLRVAI